MGCLPFNSLGGQSDISIHTSVKEAAGNVPGKGSPPYIFQSMPPRRRRPIWRWIPMQSSRFQSTPPRRRRLQTKNYMRFLVLFQSTPPRRRRQCSILTIKVIHYFNPRLREGGDEEAEEENSNILISIHASAKEATWSVTITKNHRKNFNPRLREGGDD